MVDTSAVGGGRAIGGGNSDGAGVGYGVEHGYGLSSVERGIGMRRGYLLFNTAGDRADLSVFSLWDWPGEKKTLRITDGAGESLPFQILEEDVDFWGHKRTDIAVSCPLPSMGWRLIIADEDADTPLSLTFPWGPRVHRPYEYVLENELLRAELDPVSGAVRTLTDKRSGQTAASGGGFFGLTESPDVSNPAWMIGRHTGDEAPVIAETIEWLHKGELRGAVKVTGRYKNSKISYVISLDKGADYLTFTAEVDWLEIGAKEIGMPQLRFKTRHAAPATDYLYDIPLGWLRRPAIDMDVPGLTCACSCPAEGPALAILSRDKYGYRCFDGVMSLTLLHSSYRPDPYPEFGRHDFTFHLAVPGQPTPAYVGALSKRLCHPAFPLSVTAHGGELPAEFSLLRCDAAISGVKPAEDGSGDVIIRLYGDRDSDQDTALTLREPVVSACLCSLTEVPGTPLAVSGRTVKVPLRQNVVATVRVKPR